MIFMDVEEDEALPWIAAQRKVDLEKKERERIQLLEKERIDMEKRFTHTKLLENERKLVEKYQSEMKSTLKTSVVPNDKMDTNKSDSSLVPDKSHPIIDRNPSLQLKWAEPLSFGHILVFGGILSLFCLSFIFYQFLLSLHLDLTSKVNEKSLEMTAKVTFCAKQYTMNQCETIAGTIPHMGPICLEWLTCMQSIPSIDRLSIFGQVFSQLVNAFINPLSWKALTVTSVWLFISLFFLVQAFRYCKREIHFHQS
jgi:hypothetical protein